MEKTGLRRISEPELVSMARKKNQSAFMELYDRNKDGLKIHLGKLISPWEVDDICMQTFLKAFLHIDSYDSAKSEFKTWLYTIGWNTALDHLGKKKREQENMPTTSIDSGDAGEVTGISDPDKTVEESLSRQEDYQKLLHYINELGDLYKDIAVDRFINEHEYNEIAVNHNLPINTVKTRIKRAKEMLQKMMETADLL